MRISDNILLTEELMYNYHLDRGPSRCALKVDIQIAYDTVDWNFLGKILIDFGFHSHMVLWIMECVASTSFFVSVNGSLNGFFKGMRGLHQGDPLSPYSFTLVVDILSLILKREVEIKQLMKGFLWCNGDVRHGKAKISLDAICLPKRERGLEFTSEYGISEDVHPDLPGPEDRIVDFLEDFSGWTKEYFPPPWTGAHMLQRMRCRKRTPTLDMDLFNLISAPNPSKVKTGLRLCAAHEVPLLTATASRVIDMEDPDAVIESFWTPSAIEKSPLDFNNENPASPMTEEVREEKEVAALEPRTSKKRGRKEKDRADANAPPKILTENVATMEVQDTRSAESAGSGKLTSSPSMVGSPREIYQPGWGVTNSYRLDTPDACQDVAMDSQLRLRFEQEVRLLKKARAQIARRDQRIQVKEEEIKKLDQEIQGLQNQTSNLKTLLEFLDLRESHDQLTHQVSTLQTQVTGEERIKAAFEDDVGRRWAIGHGLRLAVMKCAESIKLRQAFANVVSTRIAKGMSEGLPHGIEHGKAGREVRDPRDIWAVKEEMLLEEAIAANVSRTEKKKKCRLVCRTHRIGSAHHVRSDSILVSVPTVAPQGLAILLADVATQTETSEEYASPRLLRSKSLQPMYNLDWP
uniref:Reverse transcriptase domain-containing protein n=1 Tax=Tanacetum cinerariifolium TaxID=118510 RepID=A0A699GZT4_TANCI|nr:hypothetical protein [Tanacetum cinerariifolium]